METKSTPLLDNYKSYVKEKVFDGYNSLLESYVERLFSLNSDLTEKYVESLEGNIFLDPHIVLKILYDPVPEVSLESLLLGYLKNQFFPEQIKLYTNQEGNTYIPRYGDILTDYPNQVIQASLKKNENKFHLTIAGKAISYQFRPINRLYEIDCEVLSIFDPYFRDKFGFTRLDLKLDENLNRTCSQYSAELDKAIGLIKEKNHWFFELIKIVMRKFLIHQIDDFRSCASLSSPGVSFIHVKHGDDVVFFMEEVIHQCSHNLFYIAIKNGQECFNFDAKETRMSSLTGNTNDQRTAFGAFHSLFTLSNITLILPTYLDHKDLNAKQVFELKGRLSDNTKRFQTSLNEFHSIENQLTGLGKQILKHCNAVYDYVIQNYSNLVYSYDTSNQPYVFSFHKFLELNKDLK